MHNSFLQYLVDPHTKEPLKLTIKKQEGDFVIEGTLSSKSNTFPIVNGIPRFAGGDGRGDYAKSFGYQWKKFSKVQFESNNIGKPMQGFTLNTWEKITSITTNDLGNGIICDFGCGAGRYIEVVLMKKGRAIGIDLSEAVEAAAENFKGNPNVLICQGDVLNPPIKPLSMDGVFSIGVLHHTPDPFKGFKEMVKCCKPNGWVSVCVYGRGYYSFPTVTLFRNIFKLLWPLFKHYPPLIYSYFITYLTRILGPFPLIRKAVCAVFPFLYFPDINWSLLDTFDSLTPSYQSVHESYEIFQWLKQCGLKDIEPSDMGFTSYHGRVPEDKK